MIDVSNHLFTPLRVADGVTRECIACPVPPEEHADELVLASYEALRSWRPAIAPALSCGHRAPLMHSIDGRWDQMERGVECAVCSTTVALAAA